MIKQDIEADLKKAMLARDAKLVSVLRTLKGSMLDVEIALNKRDSGLNDQEIIDLFVKESKKRIEASKIYKDAGDTERESNELYQAEVIKKYLPNILSEEEINVLVQDILSSVDNPSISDMGKVISEVKKKANGIVDGALVAKIVKGLIEK